MMKSRTFRKNDTRPKRLDDDALALAKLLGKASRLLVALSVDDAASVWPQKGHGAGPTSGGQPSDPTLAAIVGWESRAAREAATLSTVLVQLASLAQAFGEPADELQDDVDAWLEALEGDEAPSPQSSAWRQLIALQAPDLAHRAATRLRQQWHDNWHYELFVSDERGSNILDDHTNALLTTTLSETHTLRVQAMKMTKRLVRLISDETTMPTCKCGCRQLVGRHGQTHPTCRQRQRRERMKEEARRQ